MARTRICRLISRTELAPTGIIEGGLVDGDLNPYFLGCEFSHEAVAKSSSIILKLKVPKSGIFVRNEPVLVDDQSKNRYLIEYQLIQDGNNGQPFRGELGEPSIIDDPIYGEILSIACEAIDRDTRDDLQSLKQELKTPKQRFISLVDAFNSVPRKTIIGFTPADPTIAIDLPDEPLRQNWEPFGPTKMKDLQNEVISRLEEAPQLGGTLLDYYYDYIPSTLATRKTDVFASEFGKLSSGVVITPYSVNPPGAENEKKINMDNIAYKNYVMVKMHPNKGTLPTDHQIARSYFLHATARPVWDPGTSYVAGAEVKRQFSGTFPDERYFKCKQNVMSATPPESDPANWSEDYSIDPTNQAYISFNPLYDEYGLSAPVKGLTHLVGQANSIFDANRFSSGNFAGWTFQSADPNTWRGFFFDWNVERTIYDRGIASDPYQRASVKSVNERRNTPPLRSALYDGYRIILGTLNVNDFSIGPGFEGMNLTVDGQNAFTNANRGKILEYNGDPDGIQGFGDYPKDTEANGWILSDPPTDTGDGLSRVQDFANDNDKAQVLVWDRNARAGTGDWVVAWDVSTGSGLSSPYHLVKSIQMVTGATGIPYSAFEATFNWKDDLLPPPFGQPGSSPLNKNSRGVWISFINPMPRKPIGTRNTGDIIGKDREFPYLDAYNLNRTLGGKIGWLHGKESLDLGRISGTHFKLRIGCYTSSDDSALALGVANIPMTYWAMDKWGHVYFHDFTHPVNGAWETYDIAFGPRAPQNYFYSRFDSLIELLGYKIPWNVFIKEREFTGLEFDWRFVKYWGVFSKQMYAEDIGMYLGSVNQFFRLFTMNLQQFGQKWFKGLIAILTQTPTGDTDPAQHAIHHAKIAIDEFHWVKEAYAVSDDTPPEDPRPWMERMESEQDHITGTAKAISVKARREFFPQFWHVGAKGDPRIKVGQRFIVSGPKVPGGSIELVAASVKHIDNVDGYTMDVFGVRKFVKT